MNIGIYGTFGEKQAQNYLKKRGYKILATNYVGGAGEIDIIALEAIKARKTRPDYNNMSETMKAEDYVVFVEVKARNNTSYGTPSDYVDHKKQEHYNSVSLEFFERNPYYKRLPYRFDIIEVVGKEVVNHYINAF